MVVPTKLITPEIHVEPHVQVPKGARKVTLTVRTELRNDSEHDFVLHAPDLDDEVFWHVLDEQHRELLRERPPKGDKMPAGVESFRSLTVASGHSEHENETLEINARDLEDGHTYTVRAEIYGQVAEAEFVAFVAPRAAHKRRAKAGGKVAKKKSTKRTRSPEKAAKKTSTKGAKSSGKAAPKKSTRRAKSSGTVARKPPAKKKSRKKAKSSRKAGKKTGNKGSGKARG